MFSIRLHSYFDWFFIAKCRHGLFVKDRHHQTTKRPCSSTLDLLRCNVEFGWIISFSSIKFQFQCMFKSKGGQTVFSAAQEQMFANHLLLCADQVLPVSQADFLEYIKNLCIEFHIN